MLWGYAEFILESLAERVEGGVFQHIGNVVNLCFALVEKKLGGFQPSCLVVVKNGISRASFEHIGKIAVVVRKFFRKNGEIVYGIDVCVYVVHYLQAKSVGGLRSSRGICIFGCIVVAENEIEDFFKNAGQYLRIVA